VTGQYCTKPVYSYSVSGTNTFMILQRSGFRSTSKTNGGTEYAVAISGLWTGTFKYCPHYHFRVTHSRLSLETNFSSTSFLQP